MSFDENNTFQDEAALNTEHEAAVERETIQQPAFQQSVQPVPPKKKGWTTGKVIALVLCFSLIGSLLGAGGALLGYRFLPFFEPTIGGGTTAIYQGKREPVKLETRPVDTSKPMTPAEVYAANVNATVGITTSVTTTNFWGYPTTTAVAGSGFVLTEDGYIATNYHVVKGATSIKVSMYDGSSYPAYLLGYNQSKDVAVLKMDVTGLQPVILGDSDQLNVGEQIMAVGNPLGELTFSLSAGIVSALEQEVTFSDSGTMKLIQTDCAINSGNSGGAMFNSYGEVVGIATGKYSGATGSGSYIDNIGFAVPINDIKGILEQVITKGYASNAYLGVTFTDVSDKMLLYGIPAGADITAVDADSPAKKAGIRTSDIITHVNGVEVKNANNFLLIMGDRTPGEEIELTIYRGGDTIKIKVTLGEKIMATEY